MGEVSAPRRLQSLSNSGNKPAETGGLEEKVTSSGWFPPTISNLEDTGLTKLNVADMILRVLYNGGDMTGRVVTDILKLPFTGVLDAIFEFLKREQMVEVKGGGGVGDINFRYTLTGKGLERAKDAMERTQYAGAAPVNINQYLESLHKQNAERPPVHQRDLRKLMNNLVIADEMLTKIGPAVNSGKAIFLYGPPGNGKTTIAERVGEMILGQDMWIPYSIDVDGQVIQLFDEINHRVAKNPPQQNLPKGVVQDPRWICIQRPMIMVGGELTMAGLDLVYDSINKFYEAPFQMKANGGLFLIDDFGRQQVSPIELLNRWIVPLETRIDFLTLNNGRKIGIPFYVMTIFSTNLDPKDLVDEAFLRRIRHKIEVGNPDLEQFKAIFQIICKIKKVPFDEAGFNYLVREWYVKFDRDFRMVHPRDLIAQMKDISDYMEVPLTMDNIDLIDRAAASYFVEL